MPAALDLAAVRRFTEDLQNKALQCDHGEGLACSTLEESIGFYDKLCAELRTYLNQWARAIFTAEVAFDATVEELLRKEARRLLHRAKQVAAVGRAMDGQCFELQGLQSLHYRIADLDYLLENWVHPRPAISPAPRVKLPAEAARQIMENLKKLPILPTG